jgi:ABC-type sugar transport system substrate-binding protein
MKVKKLLGMFLAMAMTVSMIAGCGATKDTASASTNEVAASSTSTASENSATGTGDKFKVAFLPTDMSATFAAWLSSELTTAFKKYPDMELTVMDSKNKLETQLNNLETCVSQKYDYIILLPIQPSAEDDIVKGYIEKGTPIEMINLDDLKVEKASSVIANPFDLGKVVSTYAKTQLKDDANVVVLLGPSGNTDSIERRRAYEEVLFSKTKIKILDEQIGDWEKSKGMSLMENWIQAHPGKIDAVISMNDAMAIGAYEAAKSAGVADKIKFFGVDGLADAAVSIDNGEMNATALQDAKVMAEEGARIAHDVLTKKNTNGFEKIQIPVTLITKDNVSEFIKRYTDNGMISK